LNIADAGARDQATVPVALAAAVKAGADGLFVNASSLNSNQRTVIAEFAQQAIEFGLAVGIKPKRADDFAL
jgi:hypothetical protein